eukprot:153394-Rhodomonas_salina.3
MYGVQSHCWALRIRAHSYCSHCVVGAYQYKSNLGRKFYPNPGTNQNKCQRMVLKYIMMREHVAWVG